MRISVDEYDALAIPGGFEVFGFYEGRLIEEKLLNLIRQFDARKNGLQQFVVGASPVGKSGVLKIERRLLIISEEHLNKGSSKFRAIIVNEPIVVDDNIITLMVLQTASGVAPSFIGETDFPS